MERRNNTDQLPANISQASELVLGQDIALLGLTALLLAEQLTDFEEAKGFNPNKKFGVVLHNLKHVAEGLEELIYDYTPDASEFNNLAFKAEAYLTKAKISPTTEARLSLYILLFEHHLKNGSPIFKNHYSKKLLPIAVLASQQMAIKYMPYTAIAKRKLPDFYQFTKGMIEALGVEYEQVA